MVNEIDQEGPNHNISWHQHTPINQREKSFKIVLFSIHILTVSPPSAAQLEGISAASFPPLLAASYLQT